MELRILRARDIEDILILAKQLNPHISIEELTARQEEMFKFENYHCFGFIENGKLVGISSGWISVRHYCGKQLELDNVIVNNQIQSKGYGKKFMGLIREWAKENNCKTIELNTYVQNAGSHKFYFNQGFNILGFHFQNQI